MKFEKFLNILRQDDFHLFLDFSFLEEGSPRALTTAYTLRQAKLNQELQEINHDLALKEHLLQQVMANEDSIASIRQTYEKSIKELEEQINLANKEKSELKDQLTKTSNNPTKMWVFRELMTSFIVFSTWAHCIFSIDELIHCILVFLFILF